MFDDVERIQRRESQRQYFLDGLKNFITEEEEKFLNGVPDENVEKTREQFYFIATIALISQEVEKNKSHDLFGVINQGHWMHQIMFMVSQVIFPMIKKFTSVESEQGLLCLSLAEFTLRRIKSRLNSEILTLSIPPAREQYLRDIGLADLQE